jgi:electron transport complex protein RnfC
MGGATFPTHMKLQPPPDANVDVLIINGAECEPYLTCDHRIMLERVSLILDGIEILQKYFSFKKIYIGIEVNKLNAIHLLEDSISNLQSNLPVEVIPLQKKYPQGAEKNLIEAITKRVVPISKLPFSVGCIVQNVATISEISSAVRTGMPLTKSVLTATGDCLKDPKNLEVPIGTLLSDIVDFCGGFIKEPKELIFGGPMMGINQRSQDVPVLKGTSGIIFLQKLEDLNETSCIRCGRCVTNCPMGLMPYRFVELTKNKKYLDTNDYFVSSCIECGLCTYNCPARIPILNYIRLSKNEIKHARRHS